MKEGIHPEYRNVVFQDTSTGIQFLIGSTIKTQKTCEYEGATLPLVTVDISSASHPFFTGEERIMDIEGRVDKFKARAASAEASREKRAAAAKKQAARRAAKVAKAAAKTAR